VVDRRTDQKKRDRGRRCKSPRTTKQRLFGIHRVELFADVDKRLKQALFGQKESETEREERERETMELKRCESTQTPKQKLNNRAKTKEARE
jgi:hypothetical protein